MSLESTISAFFSRFSINHTQKIALAYSGGSDSSALLHALIKLGYKPIIVYVNFQLRQSAIQESSFVQNIAESYQLPIHTTTVATLDFAKKEKISIEMAARRLRYDYFDLLYHQNIFECILTAHHLDDDIEHFILQFLRKFSLLAIKPIPEKRNYIYRPILEISKESILAYLCDNKIDYVKDETNFQNFVQRNRVRNLIIPKLTQINQNFKAHTLYKYEEISQITHWVEDELAMLKQSWSENGAVDLTQYLHKPYLKLILGFFFQSEIKHSDQIELIALALHGTESKTFDLTNLKIEVKRGRLMLLKYYQLNSYCLNSADLPRTIALPYFDLEIYPISNLNPNQSNELFYIPYSEISWPLEVLPSEMNEKFPSFSLNGKHKSIRKILQEAKCTKIQKMNTYSLKDQKITWSILAFSLRVIPKSNENSYICFRLKTNS